MEMLARQRSWVLYKNEQEKGRGTVRSWISLVSVGQLIEANPHKNFESPDKTEPPNDVLVKNYGKIAYLGPNISVQKRVK